MVERDVVLAKVSVIDRCLNRIADVRSATVARSSIDADDIVILNLTRATQAAIDLASHVIATERYGLPDSVAATFSLLESQGLIEPDLASRLRKMVGFRNIAVHDYQTIDPRIVEAIAGGPIEDLRRFAAIIVRHFGIG
jgi:uncharacterized protein YutE (UPF0331/DUF86 family)